MTITPSSCPVKTDLIRIQSYTWYDSVAREDITNTWYEYYYMEEETGYTNMPWIKETSGIGENSTAGEPVTISIDWKADYLLMTNIEPTENAELNAVTYVV
jgi:hypothetical protein